MITSNLMPVDAFPVVDLQSNSEQELTFGSAAPAPIGDMTLPDSQGQ